MMKIKEKLPAIVSVQKAKKWNREGLSSVIFGEYEEAIEDFNKAEELSPTIYLEAYFNRGIAYYYLKQYEKAIEDFNKAEELSPTVYVEIYFNRGIAYHYLGQYEKALEEYNKVIKISGDPIKYNRVYHCQHYAQKESQFREWEFEAPMYIWI